MNQSSDDIEVSVISLHDWAADNEYHRLDSEYQLQSYRSQIEKVRSFGARRVRDDAPTIIHPQEILREYVDEPGVWFLRAQNVRPLRIETSNKVLLSAEDAAKLTRNAIRPGDVLLTRTGANRGQCATYDRTEAAIASSHTFIIRTNHIDPDFLAVFLNTRYGVAQIDKGVYGAAQPEIAPYYLENIWVPNVSTTLVSLLKTTLEKSRELLSLAERRQTSASDSLFAALGVTKWSPPSFNSWEQNADMVRRSRRLDAEFFNPKHLYAENLIAARKFKEVDNVAAFVRSGPAWPSSSFVGANHTGASPFVRIRNCKPGIIEVHALDRLLPEGVAAFDVLMAEKGDIAIGMDGIKWFYAGVLDGSAFINQRVAWIRLQSNSFDPLFAQLVINSPFGQAQLLRRMTIAQTVGHITLDDVRAVKIPILPNDQQMEITNSLQAAVQSAGRSTRLLAAAKHALELAIETGEEAAISFLSQTAN